MTAPKIISELREIDEYLDNVTSYDDLDGSIVVKEARARRETLVEKLRLHGVGYEGVRAAERLQKEQEHETLLSELNATLGNSYAGPDLDPARGRAIPQD
jgi:hypothetical protein